MTKILVVEDEDSFSDALAFLLQKEGFETVVADTGPKAIAEFEKGGADLILLDLMRYLSHLFAYLNLFRLIRLPFLSQKILVEVIKQQHRVLDRPIIMIY